MLGAIIGDIAGSTYEAKEIERVRNKEEINIEERKRVLDKENTPLFPIGSSYTDDSVLSIAIADALLNDCYFPAEFEKYLKEYGLKELSKGEDDFGRNRFGKGFCEWLNGGHFTSSYGNGCAMRISPVPMYCDSINKVYTISHNATCPTHDHDESYTAVDAVCLAIYYAKKKKPKDYIKRVIEQTCGYDLNFNFKELQKTNTFTSRAKDSVPQAIYCFLISDDFEDSIRKAISIGGDTDTIASITGAIAENYYGIPQSIKAEAESFISEDMKEVLVEFYSKVYHDELEKNKHQKYNNSYYKRLQKTKNTRKN